MTSMANHLCGDLQGTDGQGGHNLGSTNGQPDVLATHVDGSDMVTTTKCEKQEREKIFVYLLWIPYLWTIL
ncbi:hypothetical protein BDA96_05G074400 [Sorghum bicolor]|uniref:Uncharacterized protein n=1 Tax=Sorghum bicolor TaxID=4558 RepID=A0A921QYJ4_SORBI|nr:hypothetical protein BDA96_05G074400 [Sorghum bicolor]